MWRSVLPPAALRRSLKLQVSECHVTSSQHHRSSLLLSRLASHSAPQPGSAQEAPPRGTVKRSSPNWKTKQIGRHFGTQAAEAARCRCVQVCRGELPPQTPTTHTTAPGGAFRAGFEGLHLNLWSPASRPHIPSLNRAESGASEAGRLTTLELPSTREATRCLRGGGEGQQAARLGVEAEVVSSGEGGSWRQGGEESGEEWRGRERGREGAEASRDRDAPRGRRVRDLAGL
ncbi:hypothetical protein E2C01_027691 [Portunus trituberculatus]|uniref:Uncharacterized protein n=1 Tax=Portunus trituberculatus TaxID=210409 RepID=A0A5B7ELZ9_PORTR|nr:hypothetical protein [Portunus trituberculatus]